MNRTNQQYPAQSRTSIRKLPSLHGMAVLKEKLLADCFVDKHKACSECSKQKKQLGIHVLTLTVTRASYVFSKVLDSILATLMHLQLHALLLCFEKHLHLTKFSSFLWNALFLCSFFLYLLHAPSGRACTCPMACSLKFRAMWINLISLPGAPDWSKKKRT